MAVGRRLIYLPLPVLAALGIAFPILAVLAFRRGGERDLVAPPRPGAPMPPPADWPTGAAPSGSLPPELETEVRALLAADRKIEAIKVLRAATGLSLLDAKNMVERM